ATRREPVETIVRQLIDAALLFTAAYSAVWFLLLDRIVDRNTSGGGQLAVSIAYPTFDLALLALATRFAFSSGRWPLPYRMLTGALFLMFVGDMSWRLGLAAGSYTVSSAVNVLFMGGYVLFGAAGLHPSVAQIKSFGVEAATATPGRSWRRFALLALAL